MDGSCHNRSRPAPYLESRRRFCYKASLNRIERRSSRVAGDLHITESVTRKPWFPNLLRVASPQRVCVRRFRAMEIHAIKCAIRFERLCVAQYNLSLRRSGDS